MASGDVNGAGDSDLILAPQCKRSQCRVVAESNNSHRDSLVVDRLRWDLANDRSQIILHRWIDRVSTLGEF